MALAEGSGVVVPLDLQRHWRSNSRLIEFVKFIHVGLFTNMVYFSTLALLRHVWNVSLWLDAGLAYLASAVVNYGLHYRFTFRSMERHHVAIARYAAVQAVGLTLNSLILHVLVTKLDAHYVIGQGAAILFVTGFTFWVNRLWVFSPVQQSQHTRSPLR